jgi:hypothetical protein
MVCNTQNYWVFVLSPSPSILEDKKHDISETDPVSKMSCFLFSRILNDEKSPKTQ